MKKKDFKREIWILLAEETISREQYANFGRIENGEAEAERWLGCIMRWLCRIQEEYWLEKVQETAALSLRKNAFTRLRCRNTLQKRAVSDRKKQAMNKKTWGLFPQKHKEPEKYMEMMKQAVLLKSIAAFSYKKIIYKEGLDMKRQMNKESMKGSSEEDYGSSILDQEDLDMMLKQAGISSEDMLDILCVHGEITIRVRNLEEWREKQRDGDDFDEDDFYEDGFDEDDFDEDDFDEDDFYEDDFDEDDLYEDDFDEDDLDEDDLDEDDLDEDELSDEPESIQKLWNQLENFFF